MEDFYQYTVEELVLSEAFRDLVLNPDRELEFRQWIDNHPEQSRKLVESAEIIGAVRVENDHLSEMDRSAAVQQIFELTTRKKTAGKLRPLHYWAFTAAAVLAVIIGFYILPSKDHSAVALRQSEYEKQGWEWNNTTHSRLIQLSDGSSIFLKPGSAVRYPAHFETDIRNVELQGEAFFEIAPDKSRPFYVHAGGAVTKVLGTSFSVRAFGEEDDIIVGVRSGKVNVSRANNQEGEKSGSVMLMTGQQATVRKTATGIQTSVLRSDDAISQFLKSAANGENIEVVHYLNTARHAFDLQITFDPKKLKPCRVRANFEGMHFMEQIDAMCKAINATYQVNNGAIFINSPGC